MTINAAKSLPARSKSAGTPDEGQLAAIRKFCLADMAADALYTRSFVLAHNCIDRDGEVFDEGLLNDFARTLPGKGIFIRHPNGWDGDSGPAEGKVYAAGLKVVSLDEAKSLLGEPGLKLPPDRNMVTLLTTDGYFVKTPENGALLAKIDAGIAGEVSIGFSASERVPIKDADGRELQAKRLLGPGEGLEQSIVWLGAQQGARAFKNANRNPSHREETAMDQKEFDTQITAEKAKVTDLQAQVKALEPFKATVEGIKTALGADAALLDNPAGLALFVQAGKGAREALVDDIVADLRQKGAVGDSDDEVKKAKAAYAAMPFEHLKAFAAAKGGTTDAPANPRATKSALGGGNPNNTGAKDAPPAGSLAGNPLI